MNVFLIGYRGSGKTTVAAELGVPAGVAPGERTVQALITGNNPLRLASTKLLSYCTPRAYVGPTSPMQLRDIPEPADLDASFRQVVEAEVAFWDMAWTSQG